MSNILGIDYGKKKIGIAIGDDVTKLAEPYKVIHFVDMSEAISKLSNIANLTNPQKIVVGISEGQMSIESQQFGKQLKNILNLPVFFQDETLTSYEAQQKSIEAGIQRKKRKGMEDAYAATIILQSYLDG